MVAVNMMRVLLFLLNVRMRREFGSAKVMEMLVWRTWEVWECRGG